MQTLIKKWDDLSIDEVQSIFGLRSEVFIVEQECPYQDIDGRDPEADHLLLYEKNIMSIIRLNLFKKYDKKGVFKNNQTYKQLVIGL